MTTYVVSYDLIKTKDYAKITAAIEAYGNWCKPLESFYVIETFQTSIQVRDNLQRFIDGDDRLLVIQCDLNNWASLNLSDKVNKWMGG
ncbi:MAG: hypothetical protein VXW65_05595 [Pseudomonadota bacterium]|nr:hypothetical protein [Pseudomonadota bacterium]